MVIVCDVCLLVVASVVCDCVCVWCVCVGSGVVWCLCVCVCVLVFNLASKYPVKAETLLVPWLTHFPVLLVQSNPVESNQATRHWFKPFLLHILFLLQGFFSPKLMFPLLRMQSCQRLFDFKFWVGQDVDLHALPIAWSYYFLNSAIPVLWSYYFLNSAISVHSISLIPILSPHAVMYPEYQTLGYNLIN